MTLQMVTRVAISLLVFSRLIGTVAGTQKSNMAIVIVTDKSTTTLTDADIEFQSSRGYSFGSSFQRFGGLYVTDAVVPPEGITLKPAHLPWRSIRQIDFIDWEVKVEGRRFNPTEPPNWTKAKLTSSDGSTREVFLWNPMGREEYWPLRPDDIKVIGRLSIEGKVQDVEVKGHLGFRRLMVQVRN